MIEVNINLVEENHRLVHAMQSGVAFMMNYDTKATDPKHLRVGVNNALVEASAIVKLLVDKGICTGDEYFVILNQMLREEVDRYQKEIKEVTGTEVTLA